MPKKPKPKIEEVTRNFGLAHATKSEAEKVMAKNRKMFFDLIEIPESKLARQTIYYDGDDPEQHVATLYPKWRIVKTKLVEDEEGEKEWHIVIQEDPDKKSFLYVNPLDKKVYQRSVGESSPQIDVDRLAKEAPHLWQQVTFQPPLPPRELKPLEDIDEDQRAELLRFLTEPKLTNTMQAPRKASAEELEGLPDT